MKLHIETALKRGRHPVSFHTPGHKRAGADITELSYSDNLMNPTGVIKAAQDDLAKLVGADKSFLLTDGSTAGVFAMLYALKAAGIKKLACSAYCHASVKNACGVLGLEFIPIVTRRERGIPLQPTESELAAAIKQADALLLTSPDYYGFLPPLKAAQALCKAHGKPLVIDGAHGAHLRFTTSYAGLYADMWVDGAHKSLAALTQGALVSAKGAWTELLCEGVKIFRTSSPSYPVMASVEYAFKMPRNLKTEAAALSCKRVLCAVGNDDWSKILVAFGENCDLAQRYLERRGVFPEFNDGNYLMFYLSPCTKRRHLKKLVRLVKKLPRGYVAEEREERGERGDFETWVPLNEAIGRTCARECGLFPPCLPLVTAGMVVSADAVKKLFGKNTYGLKDGKICVYAEKP